MTGSTSRRAMVKGSSTGPVSRMTMRGRRAPPQVRSRSSRLHELTGRDLYRDRAEYLFRTYGAAAAKNPSGFAHLLAAMDFMQRGPLAIVLSGDKLGANALVECVHRAYFPARVLAFSEDVPIGEGATQSTASLQPMSAGITHAVRP